MTVLFVALLIAAPAAASETESGQVIDRIVASVDGEPITLYELEQYIAKQRANLSNLSTPTRNEALQGLITEKLVAKEITAQNIRVRDEDIDRYIERIRQQNRMTEEQLKAALQQQNLTYDQYRAQVKAEIEKIQLLNRQIRGRVNITPEDIQRYYDAHKEDYNLPAKVHLRHIVLRLDPEAPEELVDAVSDRAKGIRKRLVEDKEDFATVAKQTSEDAVAGEGGDLGEIEPSQVLPEFEKALETMKEGEVSEPIRTPAGFHLLKLEKRLKEGYRPLAEISDQIKEKLYSQALDERYRRFLLEDLQKHHYVEVQL
jgi:peptidyl-prolyl cis-trans isomerase SurA